ncbi:MAG TPA: DUF6519 domain-containing protein [Gammaproteobacteria bacterium]|nr:DUF6519 domain-containing protein [Gammaproteobacteria bacterium]
MQQGTDWAGSYSRFSFDEAKRYFYLLKEQGKPVLDDDFNLLQDILLTLLRRFIVDAFGNGAAGDGFKIVGTGADNDFTITGGDGTLDGAGRIYVDGLMLLLESDVAYSGQEQPGAALTTPGANRSDAVYLDMWMAEVGPEDDPAMNDPTLATETGRRLKLFYQVLVAEGSVTPAPYTDANNARHHTYHLATLNRTAQAAIDADMVVDTRESFDERYARRNGDPAQVFAVAEAVDDGQAINKGQADTDYARLDTENVFTQEQHAPGFDSQSARKLKRILDEPLPSIEELAQIGLYRFEWRESGKKDIGTMADEVAAVLPSVAGYRDGEPSGADYGRAGFVIARRLLDEVLDMRRQITDLQSTVRYLSRRLPEL